MERGDVFDSPDRLTEGFRDEGWLGAKPLTAATALEYFSLSTFYSRDSINERAKLQNLDMKSAM